MKRLGQHCVCPRGGQCLGPGCGHAHSKDSDGSVYSGWKAGSCHTCRCQAAAAVAGAGGAVEAVWPVLSTTAFPHSRITAGGAPRLSIVGNGSMGLRPGVGGTTIRVVKTVYVGPAFDLAPGGESASALLTFNTAARCPGRRTISDPTSTPRVLLCPGRPAPHPAILLLLTTTDHCCRCCSPVALTR